jgi:hypothetical protein
MMEAKAAATARARPWIMPILVALALSGCAHNQGAPQDWRAIITHKDVDRMRDWRKEWVDALAKAREQGNGAAIAAEGALLDPDSGLDNPMPAAGDYRCRAISLGTGSGARGGYSVEAAAQCRINPIGHGILGFARLDGPQRPIGRIFPGSGAQLTFLGALAVGDESRPFDYGVDEGRSLVGLVERIGPRRWRLTIPRPPFEGAFRVIELVPGSA